MAQSTGNQELIERFHRFYRDYCRDDIGDLAQHYPSERRSLYIDYDDLYTHDPDLAEDYRTQPDQMREYAEEALRQYDLPADIKLGRAHVRVRNLPETVDIREIRVHDDHIGRLVAVQGIVRKATDVRPKITEAAFECQRCGTMTYIPQTDGSFQEPHECQGCERQGPFRVNFDQSEFVDSQKLRVQESPEGLRGGETPQSIDVNVEDDLTGKVTAGEHVTVTGVLHIEQMGSGGEKSPVFDIYMDGVAVEVEDEQFEEMEVTEEDRQRIVELSDDPEVYERMVDSIAPTIWGYEDEKLAIVFQLFSGVTKHLPDQSRIRGDLHLLLIGDPGTGKCVAGDTRVTLADGSEVPIRELVESNLDDPKPVDDGVWDEVDLEVPSMGADGSLTTGRATKVWKRTAPDRLYRIRTESGRRLDVTPTHPLFVARDGGIDATAAAELEPGEFVAVPQSAPAAADGLAADGGDSADPDSALDSLRALARDDIGWDRIESIDPIEPESEWVYDLEVEGTHTYLTNNVVSHNSQLLQYVQKVAPRSVYTSGKGSSAAGLCVTGDTLIHTDDGFRRIDDIARRHHPEPVDRNEAAEAVHDVYTFDRASGEVDTETSSHVWRMPEKPCRRIETAHGKRLEASVETPVLVCGDAGLEWREITEVETGDYVAVPEYEDIDRSSPSPREFFEFDGEKLRPTEESIELLRDRLRTEFGTLRDAAAALDLPEDFIYDTLSNRHVPLDRLGRVLDALGMDLRDIDIDRAMLRHGETVSVPDDFDEDLMYLIGLVFGDGDISVARRGDNRGYVRISNGDESLLRRATDIIDDVFDKSVDIERQEGKVPCVRLHSATIARFFAGLGMETPKDSLALDPRLTTADDADAFLRGLFDADGSVSIRDDSGSSIQFSTISEDLARQVQLMLETYGIRARRRERDRRGTTERVAGREIESKSVQTHLAIYGRDIDAFADQIGFRSDEKATSLSAVVTDAPRRDERLPVGSALVRADGAGGPFYNNLVRGDDPSRDRTFEILDDRDLGEVATPVEEVAGASLVWDEVVAAVDIGEREVFDLTVPETHNFVGNGIVTHNTAAAVRDDFSDGQQWTLEAGALVLADKGVAAVDELDKMAADDRSAMHEALEQQHISISKAGINATLQSRCSLLGAANPKYGRFDQYEPVGEQIDLEPALISRFDLIFTVTDNPDPDRDADLAEHILQTNYAGELSTQRSELQNANFAPEEVQEANRDVQPAVDPDLMRKYIAYAKRTCFPAMTDEARAVIREFYVDMRAQGASDDAPVPVTARKLEALVRLAEASARVRLADEVTADDAERVVELVRSSLEDISIDPETGEFDADIVETGTSKSQRDRIKNVKGLIQDIEDEYEEGAPVDEVLDRADEVGMDPAKVEEEIENLKKKGEVYEPSLDHLRTT